MELVRHLSPEAKAEIKALSGPRPKRFLATLAGTWATIIVAVVFSHTLQNPITSLIAIYIVATRQNLLGLLIHEQTHYTGLNNPRGDLLVNIFAGYPLLVIDVENYAKVHLAHHRFFFTDSDPDFVRKDGADWIVPIRGGKLAWLFLRDMVGIGMVQRLASGSATSQQQDNFRRKHPSPAGAKLTFLITGVSIVAFFNLWTIVLVYWIVPLVTILPMIVRWGALCEHLYGQKDANVEQTSPIIVPGLLSRIFLPNLNFTLHAYHHYFPAVSFNNLPAIHRIFLREGLVRRDLLFSGQLSYLLFILRGARRRADGHTSDRSWGLRAKRY